MLDLRAPDLKDAAKHLLQEAGIDTSASPDSAKSAEALVKRVGCLPLAISHAASFAKQSHKNLDAVLDIYKSKHKYDVGVSSRKFRFLHILMVRYSKVHQLG
jgi:hypothetical protein